MQDGQIVSEGMPADMGSSDIIKSIFGVQLNFKDGEYFYSLKGANGI